MRVVFCGSGTCGTPSLRAILDAGHQIPLVVTQPARHAGRGGGLRATPVGHSAGELGLEVLACPKINRPSAVERIGAARPDVICVIDFGQKVGRAVRQTAPLEAFNLHGSLLPALRGAAPANWAIIRGCRRTGMTTFRLVDEMDAGPVYLQQELPVSETDTAGDLRARFAEAGGGLIVRTLELLASGQAEPTPQDQAQATYAPMLTKADGVIDWTQPAEAVRNRIHGVWPWPEGQAVLRRSAGGDVPVLIARAAVADGPASGEPGALDAELYVAAGEGRLEILEIKPAGKRLMPWHAFVNGYRPQAGDRFEPPGK